MYIEVQFVNQFWLRPHVIYAQARWGKLWTADSLGYTEVPYKYTTNIQYIRTVLTTYHAIFTFLRYKDSRNWDLYVDTSVKSEKDAVIHDLQYCKEIQFNLPRIRGIKQTKLANIFGCSQLYFRQFTWRPKNGRSGLQKRQFSGCPKIYTELKVFSDR